MFKNLIRYSVVFCDIFIQIKLELVLNFAVAEDFDDYLSTGHCPLHQTDGVGPLGVIRLTLFLLWPPVIWHQCSHGWLRYSAVNDIMYVHGYFTNPEPLFSQTFKLSLTLVTPSLLLGLPGKTCNYVVTFVRKSCNYFVFYQHFCALRLIFNLNVEGK